MGGAAVWAGLENAEKFFMGTAEVQQARRKLVAALDALEIPYAIVGGMAVHRMKDLSDVVELIKYTSPPRELGDQLDLSVRGKYFELWDALQTPDPMAE